MLSVEDQIVIELRRITQAIDVWSRHLLQEFGLTSPQLATLREIMKGENVSPVALATVLHLSQPTVSGILARLERRGLIRRDRSPSDRRSVLAAVTKEGKQLAAKAPPLLRDHFRHEINKLGPQGKSEILSILQNVATMMRAPEIADGPFFFKDHQGRSTRKSRRSTGTVSRARVERDSKSTRSGGD